MGEALQRPLRGINVVNHALPEGQLRLQLDRVGFERSLRLFQSTDFLGGITRRPALLGQIQEALDFPLNALETVINLALLLFERPDRGLGKSIGLLGHSFQERPVPTQRRQFLDQVLLDLIRVDAPKRAPRGDPVPLRQALVVAVALALLDSSVARHSATAHAASNQALEPKPMPVRGVMDFPASVVVAGEKFLDPLEDVGRDDSLMLAGELLGGSLVGDETDVKLAPKRSPHGVHVEGLTAV